jgi:hypothetical protein
MLIKKEKKKLGYYMKFYNLFSFLYIKYFQRRNVSLMGVHKFSNKCAEAECQSASWLDVFDGIGWICSFVAIIIAIGYIRHVI